MTMRRRTFLQSLAAAGALQLGGRLARAESGASLHESKFRHLFGQGAKAAKTYKVPSYCRILAVNSSCLAVGGVKSVLVGHLDSFGLLNSESALLELGTVASCLAFSPFNDGVLVASQDADLQIWSLSTADFAPLKGHAKKVIGLQFHPTADQVLVSFDASEIKLWDLSSGKAMHSWQVDGCKPESVAFNYDGSHLATAWSDGKVRIFSLPGGAKLAEGPGLIVGRQRIAWLGDSNRILLAAARDIGPFRFGVWDTAAMGSPLATVDVTEPLTGLLPFYDVDTRLLFLASDYLAQILCFEMSDEKPYLLSLGPYREARSIRVFDQAFMPKRYLDIASGEIARTYTLREGATTEDPATVVPVSFFVPRKSDAFQADLYPPTASGKPALTAADFFAGKTAKPLLMSLAPKK